MNLFTYDYYRHMMWVLQRKSFNFVRFTDNQVDSHNNRKVYLRHDVDLNLTYALELAKLEKELGVNSSYFVMLECDTYNLFSPFNRDTAKEIISLGHDIGLHFVPQMNLSMGELDLHVKQQASILEDLLQCQVSSFSFHRPPQGILGSDFCPQGLINTYNSRLFAKHKYISDSNHNFRSGDPIKFIENFQESSLQILIHPVWWKDKEMSPSDKIYQAIKDCNGQIRTYLRENISLAKTILQ
ncbi:hypothetical protein [Sphaerospermopsis torques-reginae]|uniref:NodB homology domain-containing protein n=1 Tax=Sphaerospermopsis torques-reginae ITEP-024 TaxID=984208 RepID=A0ABX8WU55_9CYAN|nr:hypothetical protein [Sphaerospermopsis torques-reginae]QYX29919.1 hypothetical protein K2F26_13115 [Sphaerospermopsis torques-reginae ITEP-024]